MTLLDQLRTKAGPIVFRYRCEAACAKLDRQGGESAQRLARAIRKSIFNQFTAAESQATARIEAMRTQLIASTETVQIQDFGAVAGDLNLDTETMKQGRFETRSVSGICSTSAKSAFWCRCLFSLVREFQPKTAFELGTSLGISASYQASAMKLNGTGTLTTFEGSPVLADLARATFRELGLENITVVVGRFNHTLEPAIMAAGSIDYAFIDGHHHGPSTVAYFEAIRTKASPGACLVFDDIRWSDGMKDAWDSIAAHESVAAAADLRSIGVVVLE